MVSQSKFGFEKLGATNYATWKPHMKALLAVRDCIGTLANVESTNSNKAFMTMCVEDQHLQTLEMAESAKTAWEALEALYQQTSTANLVQLKKQLSSLQMQAAESITQYVARARNIAAQIRAATRTAVDNTDLALAVLAVCHRSTTSRPPGRVASIAGNANRRGAGTDQPRANESLGAWSGASSNR
jgi:hypothetical protein